jgi:hypothetical protein
MNLPSKIKIVKSHEGLPPVGTVIETSNVSEQYYSYFPDVIDAKCEYVDKDMVSLAIEAGYAEEVKEQWQAWKKSNEYWTLGAFLEVVKVIMMNDENGGMIDRDFNTGLLFPNKILAEQARDRILETLKQFHKEHKTK